ncbi:MAG: hypothetical protein RIS09_1048 [Actinomycetota bacterium]|jgi:hypothetical protein
MKKLVSAILVSILTLGSMSFALIEPASAAKIKNGASCKTVGKVVNQKGKKFKCTKTGKKKVWKEIKAAPLGSLQRPVPFGTSLRIGDFKYALTSIQPGVNQEICNFNMFNDGCTTNGNFDPIPDPAYDETWYRFIFTAQNVGNQALDPTFEDIGVSSLGTVEWEGIFQPVAPDRLKDLTVLPGSTATGAWYVSVKNGSIPTLLVVQIGYWDKKLYFFKLS